MNSILPQQSRRTVVIFAVAVCALAMAVPFALGEGRGARTVPVAPTGPVIRFTPSIPPGSLLARSDGDVIEFSLGQRMTVADFKRLNATVQRMRGPTPGTRTKSVWSIKPASSGPRVDASSDLAGLLKHQDNETLQLPSGRRITVGQLRVLRPLLEKRLGRPLDQLPRRPSLSGPAIKVTANTNFKELLQRPDSDVIESPHGVRMTVGELKHALASAKAVSPPAR